MFKTRERKILGSILAIALFVLMVDQFSSGPDEADAAIDETAETAPAAVAESAAQPATPLPAAAPDPQVPSVTQLLTDIRTRPDFNPAQIANAFSPSDTWINDEEQVVAATDDPSSAQTFADTHRVTAVMRSQTGGYAIVNGKIVRIGQSIGGFTLRQINQSSVVFRSGRWEVELPMEIEGE